MKKIALLCLALVAGVAQADVLYSNGPVVNGSNLSVLTQPMNTYGYGAQAVSSLFVADDFTVSAGNTWNVNSIDFFSYQTGATSFTFTSATWSIVSGDVNAGTVVASGSTNVTNGGLMGYRVLSTSMANTQRPIYRVQADVIDFALGEGDYWLRWSLAGSAASGPWAPPTSDLALGNAHQANGGPFTALIESGNGSSVALPFEIHGTSPSEVPEPESIAIMLGGVALMGAALRRRRGVRAS